MSGFVCPHCKECANIFSSGGGAALANASNVAFLGAIPIDPLIGEALDAGGMPDMGSVSLQPIQRFVASLIANEAPPTH